MFKNTPTKFPLMNSKIALRLAMNEDHQISSVRDTSVKMSLTEDDT